MKEVLLAILSGVLFAISWPVYGFPIFIFVAFLPLLVAEKNIQANFKKTKLRVFGLSYITFLIWNFFTTNWLYYADLFGMLFAVLVNSLLMSLVFLSYHVSAKKISKKWSLLFLVTLWISFEYLHLHWDFSWPWLNLGNVFSENITWIQWYEFTGTFGGSLWVLFINMFVFYQFSSGKSIKKIISMNSLFIGIPIVISLFIFYFYKIEGIQKEVILLQPNIDPYTEKYDYTNFTITNTLLEQTDDLITENTEFVVAPETVLAENMSFEYFLSSNVPKILHNYIEKHPKVQFLWGIDTYDLFIEKSKTTKYSNQLRENLWGNFYNMALFFNKEDELQKYYKSKLVVGIENFPFKPILGNVMLDLGGTISTKTIQKERSVFVGNDKTRVAPIICYESVYGEYVTGYVKNGAQFLAIITNDAWWQQTQGHKQHLSLARLRAIETRKDIARSANTGISAFINQRGEIINRTKYDKKTALLGKVTLNKKQTLYVILGDYIAKISVLIVGIFIILFGVSKFIPLPFISKKISL